MDKVLAKYMVEGLGAPENIATCATCATCATWLAIDGAGSVTGVDIRADGGATAW